LTTNLVFALDVGGTFVKASIVERGVVLNNTISQYHAFAKESESVIICQLEAIILDLMEQYQRLKRNSITTISDEFIVLKDESICIGLTFPGPFDYESGISWIRNLDKFESLYGVNVREKLLQRLQASVLSKIVKDIKLKFQNDGRLFGLGASKLFPEDRILAITLGTGIGSAFIDQGTIVTKGETVPLEGYLYNQSYRGATADECFSRRGILKLFDATDSLYSGMDVKELSQLAKGEDPRAKQLFVQFGEELGAFLLPFITSFEANRLLIGGQIAKSFELFGEGLHNQLQQSGVLIEALDDALHHTFIGVSRLFES